MSSAIRIFELLGLKRQPVAVKFQDTPPPGVSRIARRAPSGCTYWKYAAEGRTFYTEAPDHYGCPIGSYTHGIDLPAESAKELDGLVGMMVQLQYIDPKEVPGIPRRGKPFGVMVYAPIGSAPFQPDVVLIVGNAKQMMLLSESIRAAGITSESSLLGRPTCAAIPAVMQSGGAAASLGCIGNRMYTELGDDELYCAIAGSQLDTVAEKLATIVNANRDLERFHLARMSSV
jgi:uncharacterized protein (DUF169 family)